MYLNEGREQGKSRGQYRTVHREMRKKGGSSVSSPGLAKTAAP